MSHSLLKTVKSIALSRPEIPALRLPPLPSPRDVLKLYKLQARKELSQNFLFESRITDKVAKAAGNIKAGDVCEVGPGVGSITRSILKRQPGRLVVIEKDRRFLPSLEMLREASQNRLEIILGDVLLFDMKKLFREDLCKSWEDRCPNIHLVGNLPFSVATPLIVRWLRDISLKQNAWSFGRVRMTLTFQKEVAERMVAGPADPQRCRLSVMCQNWCDVKHMFTIHAHVDVSMMFAGSAFIPPPDVDVGVVTLRPKIEPVIKEDFYFVEKVVRQMFVYRQKRCIRCAETLFPSPLRTKLSAKLLELAEVNPDTRAFQLTLEEVNRIVMAFRYLCNNYPKLVNYKWGSTKDEDFWQRADNVAEPTDMEDPDFDFRAA